jgi:predicted ester cyclase
MKSSSACSGARSTVAGVYGRSGCATTCPVAQDLSSVVFLTSLVIRACLVTIRCLLFERVTPTRDTTVTSTKSHDEAVVFDNRDIARYTSNGRRMPMRGFEDQYTDIVDYIVRITHRIWEEKEVGYIYDTYQHNCIVHGSMGDAHGRDGVVAATLEWLSAFPERRVYADDVIWSGNEDDGFHTSHHVTSVGYNLGYTMYGPPTGKKVLVRAIANCLAKENMIFEEWLLRDELCLINQLGYDLDTIIERQARTMLAQGQLPLPASDPERMVGQYAPQPLPARTGDGFDIEDFIRTTYHEVWNRRMLNQIARRVDPSHICITNNNRVLQGPAERTIAILNLLAMFPDAGVSVDHVYWTGDDESGYHVAVRWTLSGRHTGYGHLGAPSGARVRAMCLSQHRVRNGAFTNEFTLIDEMAIRRQIAAQRMSV